MADPKDKTGVDEPSAPAFFKIHQLACENKQDSYIDPETGYHVLTSYYLQTRGECCTNRCRHCPFGFHTEAWPYVDSVRPTKD